MENVDLTFHENALTAIAKRAIERKTGARGLRSIMEAILLDTMFELPALEGVQEVVISEEVVYGQRPAALHLCRAKEKKATSAPDCGGPAEVADRAARQRLSRAGRGRRGALDRGIDHSHLTSGGRGRFPC